MCVCVRVCVPRVGQFMTGNKGNLVITISDCSTMFGTVVGLESISPVYSASEHKIIDSAHVDLSIPAYTIHIHT